MYMIVEFTATSEIAIIPIEWLVGKSQTHALWPPYDSGKARLACVNREQPGENWQSYAVKIMYRSGKDLWAVILHAYDVLPYKVICMKLMNIILLYNYIMI